MGLGWFDYPAYILGAVAFALAAATVKAMCLYFFREDCNVPQPQRPDGDLLAVAAYASGHPVDSIAQQTGVTIRAAAEAINRGLNTLLSHAPKIEPEQPEDTP